MECKIHNMEFVRYETAGNRVQLRKQCLCCGEVDGNIYKHSECENIGSLPLMDLGLRDSLYIRRQMQRAAEWEEQKLDHYKMYNKYLQSEEWKRKREYIIKKYKNKCVLCYRQATDVHHLTYDRLYVEDERDLISICRECHQFIHGKNKE